MYSPLTDGTMRKLKRELAKLFLGFSFSSHGNNYENFHVELEQGLTSAPEQATCYTHRFNIKAQTTYGYETQCTFYLGSYPYNCGALILSNMYVYGVRKAGIGKRALRAAELIAEYCGYSHLQATTNSGAENQVFKTMALKNGWKEIDTFTNNRSENEINVLCKHFNQKE